MTIKAALERILELVDGARTLRRKDLARRYGVHYSTIHKWVENGDLPEPYYNGKRVKHSRTAHPFWLPSEILQNERRKEWLKKRAKQ
jgi:transposase